MKALKLNSIGRLYFGYREISAVLGISEASARVAASRYVRAGLLVRVRRNLYVLSGRWSHLTRRERFIIANIALSPSYISLMTALEHYEMTTQVQQNVVECVCLRRTREILVKGDRFSYTRIKSGRFRGFDRSQGFFMAIPEKAFLDALYLSSLGQYTLKGMEIDTEKLNPAELRRQAEVFPANVKEMI
ncbi:MAG: type IV toxin-antitoxin system AbiEi family antitoxin domain-containing protein, partial [Kiritimatiellae bacterium]|nr:type IV toxin-antitoxin system AbiEi family antitoxin domain-containing protein [Kiritimatiellia bacterium]